MFSPKNNISAKTSPSSTSGRGNLPFIQPKLNIGKTGDKYEQEADRAADQILAKSKDNSTPFFPAAPTVQKNTEEDLQSQNTELSEIQHKPFVDPITPGVQLKADIQKNEEEELQQAEESIQTKDELFESESSNAPVQLSTEEDIQEKEEDIQEQEEEEAQTLQMSGGGDNSRLESNLNSSEGGGSALPGRTQNEMESGFGADFSSVRVHNDSNAIQMNQQLGSQAFAHGSDIYFNEGKYNPDTDSGKHLLAHELTHTIQQGSSSTVQGKMVQKEGEEEVETPSNSYTYTNPRTREEYAIDTSSRTLTLPKIGVPRFKVPFGPNTQFQLPLGGPDRQNNHLSVWENDAMSGTGFSDEFNTKIQQENAPNLVENNTPIYYLTLKGGSARQRRGQTDGDEGVIFGSESVIKRKISRPYWTSNGQYKTHDVDHKRELQLGGGETDLQNMWMLESSANRSSGSLINSEINRRIRLILTESNDHLQSPPNFDTVKENYTITVTNGVGAGNGMRLGSGADPNQNWSLDNVKDGRHLRGLKFLTEAEVEAAGLRGSPNELVLYSNATGGRVIRIPWDEASRAAGRKDGLGEMNLWIGKRGGANLRIDSVVYSSNTGGEGQGGNGAVICTAFPGSDGMVREKTNLAFTINPAPGISYGGVISRPSVLQAALHALELRHLSPITLTSAELDDEVGLKAVGTIAPTIPLISNANVNLIIDADGVKINKIFSSSDFDFPAPFTISNTSLEIFAGTQGIGINGQVNFGIDQVGEGQIGAAASTSGGFELQGSFNFDSALFDPAEINVEYKDNVWTIGGQIGIPEGKVRGVKSATITATYSENNFSASGEAELDIPGIQRGNMQVNYGDQGFSISGDFDLSPDIPGINSGRVSARVAKENGAENYDIMVSGTAQPAIPGINSELSVTYENGALTIEGSAAYSRGMLSGTVSIGATNRAIGDDGQPSGEPDGTMRVYGGGSLTLRLTPWLEATAGVRFLPNGEIEITGRIGLPDAVDLFNRKSIDRNLFNMPALEIPIFAIPLGPRSIGIVARITGGLDFSAGFGPGQLRNLYADVTYNPDREEETTISGHGQFVIPADAGLTLRGDLGLGVSVGIASLTGGIEVAGELGLEGEALAQVDVNWSPQTGLALDALGRVTVNPKFTFDINAFARASLDLWVTSISETWRYNLASFSWGPDIQFGVEFPVNYREGEPFDMSFDDIRVIYPQLDIGNLLTGIARDKKNDIF